MQRENANKAAPKYALLERLVVVHSEPVYPGVSGHKMVAEVVHHLKIPLRQCDPIVGRYHHTYNDQRTGEARSRVQVRDARLR